MVMFWICQGSFMILCGSYDGKDLEIFTLCQVEKLLGISVLHCLKISWGHFAGQFNKLLCTVLMKLGGC